MVIDTMTTKNMIPKTHGFTLVELMVTLSVAAILATVAVPSLQSMLQNNRMSSHANKLITTLNFVRSEAVKRNASITLTAKNSNNWHIGWTVTNANNDIIRDQAAFGGDSTLHGQPSISTLTYRPTGFLQGNAGASFALCDSRTGEIGRTISISTTGRINIDSRNCL